MKTILVTGTAGFIGRRLLARLRRSCGARVIALGRPTEAQLDGDTLSVRLEDLTPSFWDEKQAAKIDAVFHLGAYTPKNRAQADERKPIVSSNINGTLALLESFLTAPRHLVFTSSLDVYLRAPGQIIDESSAVAPATLYGASKLFAEDLVRNYARSTGCYYSILRIGHIFGPGEDRYEKFIPNLIRAMLHGRQPELNGDGSTLRDFLYVDDAVDALLAAAQLNQSCDPINVVKGESIRLLEVAAQIAEIIGYRGEFRHSGSNGESLRFDNAAMKRILGIRKFVSMSEGLAREIAYARGLQEGSQR